jgi:flagellar protein FlaG
VIKLKIESLTNSSTAAYQAQSVAPQKTAAAQKTEPVRENTPSKNSLENIDLPGKPENVATAKEGQKNQQESADSQQEKQNQKLKSAVDEMNKQMHDSEAIFGIHDKTNRVTIKIVDKETKEVIKEYPPEQTLDMIAKVWELAGIMVDEKR